MVTVTRETLNEITKRLVDEVDPERIYLFGSHAYGSLGPHSDVDLLVVVPRSDERLTDLSCRAKRAIGDIGCGVDVVVRTREAFEHRASWPSNLEATVKSKGRLLYGR